jgi:hypothetical protein
MFFNLILSRLSVSSKQALVDDFRTANWLEIVPYPELVYQKSMMFLNLQE